MAASLTSDTTDQAPAASAEPVNILLVDDQPARLMAYRVILDPLQENLVEAHSGKEALGALMDRDWAVILLDVQMPDIDGFETANLIHQHPRFEKTPIIFVTAISVSDLDRIRGYKLGAVDYVMVPIIPEILRSKVAVLCELHRKRRDLLLANLRLAAANETLGIEKARELAVLNASLRTANSTLEARNFELHAQIVERAHAEAMLLDLGRRKDEFLATLAHELRNPLAALSNALNVFKLARGGSEALHLTMERQLGLLVRLIDDLLDAARISSGKLALKWDATTLQGVIESAIESITPLLATGGHQLDVELPTQTVQLHADRERLSQVFSNLLSNAVKYSAAGTPISLRACRDDRQVVVAIEDRGIGLIKEEFERIFEPFVQMDTSIERSRGGLGIGLTLARRIVEMHGGTIEVHSDGPGLGSRFSVCLPLDYGDAEADVPAPQASMESGSKVRRRALVIDDNQDSADTLAMMLQLLGHHTHCIYDPHKASAAVASFLPDMVFLDIGMPGLNGRDVARMLRAAPGGNRLVLVAVTGWGQPEERQRTSEAGFDHHLVKPVEMAVIRRICSAPPRRHQGG